VQGQPDKNQDSLQKGEYRLLSILVFNCAMEWVMKKIPVICLLLLCSGSVLAEKEQKNYLCIAETSGNIAFNDDTGKWEGSNSEAGNKFLLKINDKEYLSFAATVTNFGQKKPMFICLKGDEHTYAKSQICKGFYGRFVYSLETLRFLRSYLAGYIDGKDNNNNTPYIQIGTCSPL